jgi:RNA polymerase sigma factor (sigma-70 family)
MRRIVVVDLERWRAISAGLRSHPPAADAVTELYEILLRLGKRSGLAESGDLASEVLLEILERPGLLADVRAPEAYLRLRLRRREFVRLRRATTERRILRASSQPTSNASEERVDATVEAAHLIERFRDRLTEDELELLRLRFWESAGLDAVAESLNISYSNAAVRVFRLLARIRLWVHE